MADALLDLVLAKAKRASHRTSLLHVASCESCMHQLVEALFDLSDRC